MRRSLLVSALLLLLAGPAQAALNAYLNAKGGLAGALAIHSIVSPRDPQSGLPTGQRMHKPFRIVVSGAVDKSTPLLAGLKVGDALGEVTFSADAAGKAPFTLRDAKVTSIKATAAGADVEIEGVTAQDDWEVPAAALRKAIGLELPLPIKR